VTKPLAEIIEAQRDSDVPLCDKCGLPQSKNPHADAGKYERYLEVGTPWACVPCLTLNRHTWSQRAMKAEGELATVRALLYLAVQYYKSPEALKRDAEYHPRFKEAMDAAAGMAREDGWRLDYFRDFYLERMDALQRYQHELPEPHRTAVCNILANGAVKP